MMNYINDVPLISVCIPSYNHARFVGEAIQSIVDQTYKNVELIIIDDGSQDNSVEVIEMFREICEQRFVRFEIRARSNKGLSFTLNEGLEWARGPYFSALASDDIILPRKLEILSKILEQKVGLAGVFGNMIRIDEKGKEQGRDFCALGTWGFLDIFLYNIRLPAAGAVLRTDQLRRVKGFDKDVIVEDWSMWLKLTENEKAGLLVVPELVVKYRIHESNTHKRVDDIYESCMLIASRYSHHGAYPQVRANLAASAAIGAASVSKRLSFHYITLAKGASLKLKLIIIAKWILPVPVYKHVLIFWSLYLNPKTRRMASNSKRNIIE